MKGLKRLEKTGFDLRVTIYHAVRILLAAIVLAFFVKYMFIDTVRMSGVQMTPTLLPGDRLLMFRFPFTPVLHRFFKAPYDKAVVYRNENTLSILRVAAVSGDTLSIDSSRVQTGVPLPNIDNFAVADDELVPPDYAPRDFFDPYGVPGKGTTFIFDRLSLRDLFFAVAVIRQEHPDDSVKVTPYMMLDDSLHNNFQFNDFIFYNGRIDTLPDSLGNNWFFWNHLEEYLYQKFSDRKVSLYFTVSIDGFDVKEYIVKHNYFFLIADNRKNGLDSRYFGPIRRSRSLGRIAAVLWSHGLNEEGKWHFRFNRLGRFIP